MAFGFVIDEIQSQLALNLSIFQTNDEVSTPVAVLVDMLLDSKQLQHRSTLVE